MTSLLIRAFSLCSLALAIGAGSPDSIAATSLQPEMNSTTQVAQSTMAPKIGAAAGEWVTTPQAADETSKTLLGVTEWLLVTNDGSSSDFSIEGVDESSTVRMLIEYSASPSGFRFLVHDIAQNRSADWTTRFSTDTEPLYYGIQSGDNNIDQRAGTWNTVSLTMTGGFGGSPMVWERQLSDGTYVIDGDGTQIIGGSTDGMGSLAFFSDPVVQAAGNTIRAAFARTFRDTSLIQMRPDLFSAAATRAMELPGADPAFSCDRTDAKSGIDCASLLLPVVYQALLAVNNMLGFPGCVSSCASALACLPSMSASTATCSATTQYCVSCAGMSLTAAHVNCLRVVWQEN